MGSSALPMVGMGSYGNPTGADTGAGLNPKFEAETFKKLQGFSPVPTASTASPVPFGGTGVTPFSVPGGQNLSPALPTAPPVPTAPTAPVAPAAPGTGSAQGGNSNVFTNSNPTGTQSGGNFGNVVPGSTNTSQLNPATMGQSVDGWDLTRGIARAYGGNMALGKSLASVLGAGAGWNPQAAQAMMNDLEPYFQENMGNIMEMFGASGQRYSSTAALAAGKFGADFTSHQEALYAQMYQWAVNNYISILTGGSKQNQTPGSNTMGLINGAMGLLSSGAGAIAAGSAAGGGTAGLLAGLAAL